MINKAIPLNIGKSWPKRSFSRDNLLSTNNNMITPSNDAAKPRKIPKDKYCGFDIRSPV